MYKGLGDARPRFGRFHGSAVLLGDPADYVAPDVLDAVRAKMAAATAGQSILALDDRHAAVHPNGKERRERVERVVS